MIQYKQAQAADVRALDGVFGPAPNVSPHNNPVNPPST